MVKITNFREGFKGMKLMSIFDKDWLTVFHENKNWMQNIGCE